MDEDGEVIEGVQTESEASAVSEEKGPRVTEKSAEETAGLQV